ncbi:metal ABC transporter substrate-binding protein [Bacillus sp. V2I10]|uniref:metal ABC transporter substrate-binding protein n=1 Tax=Bacillus sp. V2I10 TaxID=3042276 RepID=UPI00278A65F8|nr:metal ABC transporter substrate-binding protein [Bacillus sp. V2I10]MDQ0859925.1 zinc transport system substrate-binding protein [Bacillus sp. V2I10]
MNRLNVKAMLVAMACFTVMVGCSNKEDVTSGQNEEATKSEEKLHVVTTFYPMYEFTKNITKDKAQVDLLIPSNIEPHDWEPTPKDMAAIQKADLLVYNSPFMETWISSIQESLDEEQPLFVEASEGINLMKGTEHDHHDEDGHHHDEESEHDDQEADHHDEDENHEEDSEQMDPHVWLSPVLAQKEVQTITESIVKQDPKNKEFYERNSKEYIQQLKELNELFRTTLQNASSKEMITQHAAFGYLAKEYGLTQVPIAGLSPSEEPSPSKLAELKEFAKEHQINVIYFEETTSPKVAQTLAGELGAETEVLNTLEGLSKEDQEKGLSYIEVMKNNLKSLEKSFK